MTATDHTSSNGSDQDDHKLDRKPPLEPSPNGTDPNGSVRFDQERQRRRNAERSVRTTAVEFLAARKIQQKLFPTAAPVLPGVEVAGIARPAKATGGDYFDFVPMLNDGVGIVVGDVSGHGFGPALLMASTRAYLRAFAQTHSDLGELLTLVNRVLMLDMEDDRFVTLILARLDLRTRSLAYASAGHPSGFILDASGHVRLCLPSQGMPLGIGHERFTASGPIPLEAGELIVFFSDGVIEAAAPNGASFGWERAVSIVRVYRKDPTAWIVANLYHAVRAFSQNAPQLDDITAVVIKVDQPDKAPRSIEPRGSSGVARRQSHGKP